MRPKLSYANVVATFALFFALSGSAVYAADKIKIYSNDIVGGAISTRKIAREAIRTGKIAPQAVNRSRIAHGAVGPFQLDNLSVVAGKIAPGAVGGAELADGSVTRPKLAADAVGSEQIEDGSVTLADLKDPVGFVAGPHGGAAQVSGGGTSFSYALSDNTWRQRAGEFDVVFGQVDATLQAGESGQCGVEMRIYMNGEEAGGGWMQTESATAEQLTTGLGGDPRINFDHAQDQEITIKVTSHGDCVGDSRIESTRMRILGIG